MKISKNFKKYSRSIAKVGRKVGKRIGFQKVFECIRVISRNFGKAKVGVLIIIPYMSVECEECIYLFYDSVQFCTKSWQMQLDL